MHNKRESNEEDLHAHACHSANFGRHGHCRTIDVYRTGLFTGHNTFSGSPNTKSLLTNGLALSIDTFQSPGEFPLGFTGSIVGTMPRQMDISLNSVAQTPVKDFTYAYAFDTCLGSAIT